MLAGLANLSIAIPRPATAQATGAGLHPVLAFQNDEARLFKAGYELAVASAEFRARATSAFVLNARSEELSPAALAR